MQRLRAGDTIAVRISEVFPIYRMFRVLRKEAGGALTARPFDLPGILASAEETIRVADFVNLNELVKPEGPTLAKGTTVIAAVPAGVRIATLQESFNPKAPALLLRDFGRFDFYLQMEVGETFASPPGAIFEVRTYLTA